MNRTMIRSKKLLGELRKEFGAAHSLVQLECICRACLSEDTASTLRRLRFDYTSVSAAPKKRRSTGALQNLEELQGTLTSRPLKNLTNFERGDK